MKILLMSYKQVVAAGLKLHWDEKCDKRMADSPACSTVICTLSKVVQLQQD